jgi:hypothetical protein
MKSRSFASVLGIGLLVIGGVAAAQQGTTRAAMERTVQSIVLDSLFTRDTTRQIVVGDSTVSGGSHYVDEDYRSALVGLGQLPAGVQADFESVRAMRRAVDSLSTRVPVRRLDHSARAALKANGDSPRSYWQAFYRRFPGSSGYIELSRVGFSRDGNTAMILIEYGCGALCGGTIYAVLERRSGKWHITRTAQPRIS